MSNVRTYLRAQKGIKFTTNDNNHREYTNDNNHQEHITYNKVSIEFCTSRKVPYNVS